MKKVECALKYKIDQINNGVNKDKLEALVQCKNCTLVASAEEAQNLKVSLNVGFDGRKAALSSFAIRSRHRDDVKDESHHECEQQLKRIRIEVL